MLDPAEVAAYEAWKLHKLTAQTDLTITAYNAEMTALAAAWDSGVVASVSQEFAAKILPQNPYRRPGMTGHLAIEGEEQ